jgi:hypothetical protein
MPPLLLAFLALGVGFLLYERFVAKPSSPAGPPQLPPGPGPTPGPPVNPEARCTPTSSMQTGHSYLFAVVAPPGTSAVPSAVASSFQASGLWQPNVVVWASTDPSVPSFSWSSAGVTPGPGVVLVRATYTGSPSALPYPGGMVRGILDCGLPADAPVGGAFRPGVPRGSFLAPAAWALAPPAPGPLRIGLHTGGPILAIAQAAQTQLAALGPQPDKATGFLPPLQWQIAESALQSLAGNPTLQNLRDTTANLAKTSQGPWANNAAAGLQPLLTQLGG